MKLPILKRLVSAD